MSREILALLAEHATAFARSYTAVTEALVRQGVPEERARIEARNACIMALLWAEEEPTGEPWED